MTNKMIQQPMVQPVTFYDEDGNKILNKTSPENRQYLLLLMFKDGSKTFEVISGRTEAREYIINNIEEIDINQSQLLTEGKVMEEAITIYHFMKYAQIYFDDNFDIEEYNDSDEMLVNTGEEGEFQSAPKPLINNDNETDVNDTGYTDNLLNKNQESEDI